MTETSVNYFTEVEDHFRAVRGTPLFRLSSLDWALVEAWKNGGVPLEAVLRGIDVAFEKWRSRPARARAETINSLAYCAQPVAAEVQAMAERAPSRRSVTKPPLDVAAVRAFLARNVATLRGAGFTAIAEALEALDIDALYGDLEKLEQRLREIEEKMIAQLRASASEATLLEAREALNFDLKPYRGRMSADQLAMLEKQFLERRLLESAGVPRLSLFHL
jgi:hypothetical protein